MTMKESTCMCRYVYCILMTLLSQENEREKEEVE